MWIRVFRKLQYTHWLWRWRRQMVIAPTFGRHGFVLEKWFCPRESKETTAMPYAGHWAKAHFKISSTVPDIG